MSVIEHPSIPIAFPTVPLHPPYFGEYKKEHFLVSGAGDEVGMNRKASIRAGDQKMVWTEPQALPWLWALHGRPRICWAVRPAHEGGIGGY